MLRTLLRKRAGKAADHALLSSLLWPRTQTHAAVCIISEERCQRSYATAAEIQQSSNKQRKKVVILGSGWAAASLAKHVDTSKFAITVRDVLHGK